VPLGDTPHNKPLDLAWASELLGVEHKPDQIEAAVTLSRERRIVLADTPDELPPIEFMFEGFCESSQGGMVYGDEKTLKTTLMAHMAVCCAAKIDLFGYFPVNPRRAGPVVQWSAEGGAHFLLDTINRVCAVYGVSRRTLDIEIHTTPYAVNSMPFLYTVADHLNRGTPALVTAEPLYKIHPDGWDGRNINTFDTRGLDVLSAFGGFVPVLGHHTKRGEGKGLRKAAGAGPAEWAGQWWHVERLEEFDTFTHKLKVSYGARGAGGGRWALLVDDKSLDVIVRPVDQVTVSHSTMSTYEMFRAVVGDVFTRRATGPKHDGTLTSREFAVAASAEIASRFGKDVAWNTLRNTHLDRLVLDRYVHRSKSAKRGEPDRLTLGDEDGDC
jgi:hypothetical protein